MSTPDREDIWAERAEIFRPAWFARLFGGRLGLGDTFWIGHFGLQLLIVPVGLMAFALANAVAPARVAAVLLVFMSVQAIVALAVFQAVLRVAWSARGAVGWRLVAVVFSALYVATAVYYVTSLNGG